jgi:hypothetical protein
MSEKCVEARTFQEKCILSTIKTKTKKVSTSYFLVNSLVFNTKRRRKPWLRKFFLLVKNPVEKDRQNYVFFARLFKSLYRYSKSRLTGYAAHVYSSRKEKQIHTRDRTEYA